MNINNVEPTRVRVYFCNLINDIIKNTLFMGIFYLRFKRI